jgi:hypothetical protein
MLEKAFITTSNEKDIRISIPFAKFDKTNRTVSGFATLDNYDQMNDCVTAISSKKAFERFRGNVREQHDKNLAVGKLLNVQSQTYFDKNSEEAYEGIFVDAYVSKGAPNTWEKVLDETLTGFSVHGSIIKEHSEYVPSRDAVIRFIDEYILDEISLVDSPGNELCNIMTIQKSADGTSTIQIENQPVFMNVFWCDIDQLAFITEDEEFSCRICEKSMDNTGWFESISEENPAEKVKEILANSIFKNESDQQMKGGSDMDQEETVENQTTTQEEPVEETTTEINSTDEPDLQNIAKAIEEIKNSLTKVHETGAARENSIIKMREVVEGVEKSIETKLTELSSKHEGLATRFKEFQDGLNTVEKRLDTVESGSAIRKSIDTDSTLQKDRDSKRKWSGAFLPPSFDQ